MNKLTGEEEQDDCQEAFDPHNPDCQKCGTAMFLEEGCAWDEDPSLNLCRSCALAEVERLNEQLKSAAKFAGARQAELDKANAEIERLKAVNEDYRVTLEAISASDQLLTSDRKKIETLKATARAAIERVANAEW